MIGKALGAFRAAYLTLAEEAEILLTEIDSTYMAGASGFYVDPHKSLGVGQIPPSSQVIYQLGNTSLAMANDIVMNPDPVSYTHLRAHETVLDLVCRLLLEKKK